MREVWVRSLGQEDLLEKGLATHSSVLAWRIPWTEEPGGLQSTGSQRVWLDWDTFTIPDKQFDSKYNQTHSKEGGSWTGFLIFPKIQTAVTVTILAKSVGSHSLPAVVSSELVSDSSPIPRTPSEMSQQEKTH